MRRQIPLLAALVGLLTVIALSIVGSRPTGTPEAASVVPDNTRVAASVEVEGVVILIGVRGRVLTATAAVPSSKGYLGVDLGESPPDAVTAWITTAGADSVPAMSVAFGRVEPGARVDLTWPDGVVASVNAGRDGIWVSGRAGVVDEAPEVRT